MRVDSVIIDSARSLRQVVQALDNNLTIADNFASKVVSIADSGIADTEIEIEHNMGRVPLLFLSNSDQAGTIYASRRSEWTDSKMWIKSSAANADVVLVIL